MDGNWWTHKLRKRVLDLTLTLPCLVLVLPIMGFISVLLLMTMGFPVFFKQTRLGYNGSPFVLYKFRTMTNRRDEIGVLLPDGDRLTKVGKLLRTTSLDELPELLNVLRGEMSIVGPRPLLPDYEELYTPDQWRRHRMPPGLAGPVVAYGRNLLSWEEKFLLDTWYVDNWSLGLDVQLLAHSLLQTFRRVGISSGDHETMERFEGAKRQIPPEDRL